mgnify:CR=1 FL=1
MFWLWMIPDFIYLQVLIHQRTIYCPHPYEFRNYSEFAWCYCYLVSGVVEPTTLYYNCFHPHVLAMNDPRFYGHLVDLSIKSYKSCMERWFHGQESYWPTLFLCPISIWRGWVCFKEVLLLYSLRSGKECYIYGHLVDLSIKSYKSCMERWFHGRESYWPTLFLYPISIWRGWVCFKQVLLLYSLRSGKECYIYGHLVDLSIKSY